MSCEECAKTYRSFDKPTPCGPCKKPVLDEDAAWVWEVYELMSSQVRTAGMGSLIGIDLSALPTVLAILEVPKEKWRYALETVLAIGNIAARYVNTANKD